jgi:hypothetical protein
MNDTLEILHVERKGQLLNTLERLLTYKLSKEKQQIIDTFADTRNSMLNLITKHNLQKKYIRNTPSKPLILSPLSHHITTPQLPYQHVTYIKYPPDTSTEPAPLTSVTFQQSTNPHQARLIIKQLK